MELITKKELKTILYGEKTLPFLLFGEKELPLEFKTGIYDAVNIANRTYSNTGCIIKAINELKNQLVIFRYNNIKYGYYFILSYLYFLINDKRMSLMSIACIIHYYKVRDNVNDWDNVVMPG